MQNKDVRIKCYKCGNSFTTDQMRYDPDKPARLVCKSCLSKGDKRETTVYDSKPKAGDKMVTYYCIKCHYKFDRRASAQVIACPYCGNETLTSKTDASSILKRAEDEDFEK